MDGLLIEAAVYSKHLRGKPRDGSRIRDEDLEPIMIAPLVGHWVDLRHGCWMLIRPEQLASMHKCYNISLYIRPTDCNSLDAPPNE